MNNKTYQPKRTARLAGLLFLVWILTGFFDMFFVSPKIFVEGNFSSSSQNILSHELLFRTSIFSGLIAHTLWIFLATVFYRLFKEVNQYQAKLLVIFVIVQIPPAFFKAAFSLAALMILKNDVLTTFELTQRQDLAILFTKMSDYTVLAIELFWGLWLLPLAYLVYQSNFIPRFLGVWLYLNGFVYVLLSFVSLVFPEHKNIVFNFGMPAMFGELALMFWLLLKGVKTDKSGTLVNQ